MWVVIEKRLKKLGMTQSELARQLGIRRMEVTRIKQGKKITLDFAFKIADVLGIDVNEFRKEKQQCLE